MRHLLLHPFRMTTPLLDGRLLGQHVERMGYRLDLSGIEPGIASPDQSPDSANEPIPMKDKHVIGVIGNPF